MDLLELVEPDGYYALVWKAGPKQYSIFSIPGQSYFIVMMAVITYFKQELKFDSS